MIGDGNHVSESYRHANCCSERDDCFRLPDNTPDDPCWGQVGLEEAIDTDGGDIFVHSCEGHRDMYDYSPPYPVTYKPEPPKEISENSGSTP